MDKLTRNDKLAIARRDERVVRLLLKDARGEWLYDRAVLDRIFETCDRYAAHQANKPRVARNR